MKYNKTVLVVFLVCIITIIQPTAAFISPNYYSLPFLQQRISTTTTTLIPTTTLPCSSLGKRWHLTKIPIKSTSSETIVTYKEDNETSTSSILMTTENVVSEQIPRYTNTTTSISSVEQIQIDGTDQNIQYESQQQQQLQQQKQKTFILNDICTTIGIPMTQFVHEMITVVYPELYELSILLQSITTACTNISKVIQQQQQQQESLSSTAQNNHKRSNRELHIKASDIFKHTFKQQQDVYQQRIGLLAPVEEDLDDNDTVLQNDEQIIISEGKQYLTVIHPLLIDDDVVVDAENSIFPSCGTVIGIYERDAETCFVDGNNFVNYVVDDNNNDDDSKSIQEAVCLANTLQPGTNLIAAAYCLFNTTTNVSSLSLSSSTYFVVSLFNSGVYIFMYNETLNEFTLVNTNHQIPNPVLYNDIDKKNNINTNNQENDNTNNRTISKLKLSENHMNQYNMNSMIVANVHSILMNGGIYSIPSSIILPQCINDNNNITTIITSKTNNDVRLLYVGAPLSYIIEQAGGMSYSMKTITGQQQPEVQLQQEEYILQIQRVLEISPQCVHESIPIIFGSKQYVQEIINTYNKQ